MRYAIVIILGIFISLSPKLFAEQTSMQDLLSAYIDETQLSNETKRDSAGLLELYTRCDLEKMQAHNLLDVLKAIPGMILAKNEIGLNALASLGSRSLPDSAIRLYINDHDMTSASFGSGFAIWSDVPIEYIDHIEVYKATSSIEFGNEVSAVVVRVYTKQAQREEGSSVRLMASDNGGYDLSFYTGRELDNGLRYFVYGGKDFYNEDSFTTYFRNQGYEISSDKHSYNLFANLLYKGWKLDLGRYDKKNDPLTGAGYFSTPVGGGIDSSHTYAHLKKEFVNGYSIQLSYDSIIQDALFYDPNYITVSDPNSPGASLMGYTIPAGMWIVQNYNVYLRDTITSAIVHKKIHTKKHKVLLGAFIKHKTFKDHAYLGSNISYNPLSLRPYERNINDISNSLNLFSLYFEEEYLFDNTTRFLLSLKEDFYRYEHGIKQQNEFIGRVGAIKKFGDFELKGYVAHTYIPATFLELAPELQSPRKANSTLDYSQEDYYLGSVRYAKERYSIEFGLLYMKYNNVILYDPIQGYFNLDKGFKYTVSQLSYKYHFNKHNKLYIDYDYAQTYDGLYVNPHHMVLIRLFNTYKKFDFYNELTYKSGYNYYGIALGQSYDYTTAVTYHYSDDISVGLRADNVFNSGYKGIYNHFDTPLPVTQQRFWLSTEVKF